MLSERRHCACCFVLRCVFCNIITRVVNRCADSGLDNKMGCGSVHDLPRANSHPFTSAEGGNS
jgi:hypothetical protein